MEEKRKYQRLEQTMPVRHRQEVENGIQTTQTKDISTGGLRIASYSNLAVGSKIDIEVHITNSSTPYYAQGEVVWLKENEASDDMKFDVGIRFLRLVSKAELAGF